MKHLSAPGGVQVNRGQLFLADRFVGWQEATLKALQAR